MARVGLTRRWAQLIALWISALAMPSPQAAQTTSQENSGTRSPATGIRPKLNAEATATCTSVMRRAFTLGAARPMRMISAAMASAPKAVSISPLPAPAANPAATPSDPESKTKPGKASAMPSQAIRPGACRITPHCSSGTSGT